MKKYGLFILAFSVIIAALIKSQKANIKKTVTKKAPITLAQWPGVIKKDVASKLALRRAGTAGKNSAVSSLALPYSPQAANASDAKKSPSRGVASVAPAETAGYSPGAVRVGRFAPRQVRGGGYYSKGNYYYGSGSGSYAAGEPSSASSSRLDSFSKSGTAVQELSSFTRTPDLSINVGVDPELAETFEDQIRKFREQNQLTAQDLQELELITNGFLSMSGSVQRGQIPLPQVNAEAIKLTRSFLSLKRRVEARLQAY